MSEKPGKLELPDRLDKRVHVALPIRVTYWDSAQHPKLEMACTYDISPRGARVIGLRCVKETGDIVAIERGKNKAFCRVVWIGEENSELRGQIGLQCIEADKPMWEAELREMEEVYDPIIQEQLAVRPTTLAATAGNPGRRRYRRFPIDGFAELMRASGATGGLEAPLKDIGEHGCLVTTQSMLVPGTSLKVVLNVANYDLVLKGEVRHAALDVGLGIEFHEIRKGDRSVLQYILRKLAEREAEEKEKEQPENARAAVVSL